MEHSQGAMVKILTCEETATWEKCRIGEQVHDGFYAVYGFDPKGEFFKAARVEPDRIRACEDCAEGPRFLCEEHKRLIQ